MTSQAYLDLESFAVEFVSRTADLAFAQSESILMLPPASQIRQRRRFLLTRAVVHKSLAWLFSSNDEYLQ